MMILHRFACVSILCTSLPISAAFLAPGLDGGAGWALQRRSNGWSQHHLSTTALDAAKIGIFFGTSTGNTETVAEMLAEEFGPDAEGPFDVDDDDIVKSLSGFDCLVVGTPTWNTGADTERSGTGWDDLYYGEMQDASSLGGKKVAVFGLGDQVSYGENYADATGELHDVFEGLGCQMRGYTSQEGYEHEASKSIRGDKFCGLLCDAVNQEDMSEDRVKAWVAQLREEGFLAGSDASGSTAPSTVDVVVAKETTSKIPGESSTPLAVPVLGGIEEYVLKLERENAGLREQLEDQLEKDSLLLDQEIGAHSTGYTPHLNPVTGKTMWTSPDGRSCYTTVESLGSKTGIKP